MIKVRLLTDADNQQWHDYVSQHPDATAYHQLAFKHAIERAYQHKCWYWLAIDINNTVVGVLASAWVKAPFSKGHLCALPFCDLGGVLGNNSDIAQTLIQQAISCCQQHNIAYFDHRSHIFYRVTGEQSPENCHGVGKVRMIMTLPETSEVLFNGFKSKLRSQIRKAEKNGLVASTGVNIEHINAFYEVFALNMRDLGSPVHSKEWFKQLIEAYGDQAFIAIVHYQNKVVAGGLVLFNGDKACIPWASSNGDYNKLAPNMLLYWTVLKFATDRGCKIFDFGRSTINEGTYRFKRQWGAKPQRLEWDRYDHSGQLLPLGSQTQSKLRKLLALCWKQLPVELSTKLGSKIRRYISL